MGYSRPIGLNQLDRSADSLGVLPRSSEAGHFALHEWAIESVLGQVLVARFPVVLCASNHCAIR